MASGTEHGRPAAKPRRVLPAQAGDGQLLEVLGRDRLASIVRSPSRRSRAASLLPGLLSAYLFVKGFHPELPGLSCPLRALTGIPCPGCFLTRAVAASLHGDLSTALHWHPIGPIAAVLLLVWSVLSIRQKRLVPAQGSGVALAALAVLLSLVWVVRMVATYRYGLHWFPT